MVLGLGWPRGVGMVRKWKWYPLTKSGLVSIPIRGFDPFWFGGPDNNPVAPKVANTA